jgi:glutamyl-tRNA synthetase
VFGAAMVVRGRYAPSPTGALHLGNARTALIAWLDARQRGGAFIMRIEDLDRARIVAGAEARLLDELAWLGIDWDEGPDIGGPYAPYRQRERVALYDQAIDRLLADGRAFPCACSRADVARAASAPHPADDDEPRYSGTCRGAEPAAVAARAAAQGRRPSIRFAGAGLGTKGDAPGDTQGQAEVEGEVDDFVLRRADGVAAYQLAVVVDDLAMRITRVVRGADLLRSTPRQQALYRALGAAAPDFVHVPLVLAPDGEKLAKRTRPTALGTLRDQGVAPAAIVGALAASANLCAPGTWVQPRELVAAFDLARIPPGPVTIDASRIGVVEPDGHGGP